MEETFNSRYEFDLDPFQNKAVTSLSKGGSVLVVAPTGSGKTVVAEYGMFRALTGGGKAFYTTPLKALSNQKFRDFRAQYGPQGVGLLTGDNSINSSAPLVVMTTEVLRNMIYEASPLLDQLSLVVLDECHYIHDTYRGAVWEEIIINLPTSVKLVALSATVSNAGELGEWMDQVRGNMDVLVTTLRPVPLRFYYFVGNTLARLSSHGLPGQISDYYKAARRSEGGGRRGGRRKLRLRPWRTDVIKRLDKAKMLPAIYFIFSRVGCEAAVDNCLIDGLDLTSPQEKNRIRRFVDERVSGIDQGDLECLGFSSWRGNLMAGFAAHHAGVIPIFKQIVEELFSSCDIKVIFATETLSLGINMPARTVVIESLTKYSGVEHRVLNAGEFTQLSGRAGRRGIDSVGNAVILYQRDYPLDVVRSLAKSEASPVVSSFQVSYNMAINLLAVMDEEKAVRILNLSFAQFAADKEVLVLEQRTEALEEQRDRMLSEATCADGGNAVSYQVMFQSSKRLRKKLSRLRREKKKGKTDDTMRAMKPGDVFEWVSTSQRRRVAVVRRAKGKSGGVSLTVVDGSGRFRKASLRNTLEPPRVLGSVKSDLISSPSKKARRKAMSLISRMEAGESKEAEEVKKDSQELKLVEELEEELGRLREHVCHECEHRKRCSEVAKKVIKERRALKKISRKIKDSKGIASRDFKKVLGVLESLGYLEAGRINDRGRLLCKIYNECDLLLVEVIRQGVLDGLDPEELASLCSWFVYKSRGKNQDSRRRVTRKSGEEFPTSQLYQAYLKIEGIHEKIESLENSKQVKILGTIDIGFGFLCYRWATGEELGSLLEAFPDRSPGDMVRSMKQVIDLLRQLEEAAEDESLSARLRDGTRLTYRGVVAFDSLAAYE